MVIGLMGVPSPVAKLTVTSRSGSEESECDEKPSVDDQESPFIKLERKSESDELEVETLMEQETAIKLVRISKMAF